MSSLAKYYSSNLVGFFSYSREDDVDLNEVLSKFRNAIQAELSAQLGRNRDNFRVWQDRFAIPHGALWQKQISDGIKQSAFFIPIVTPRMVNSSHCAFEFESFVAREKELDRDDLIFPILYISVPELEDGTWKQSSVLKIVNDRQYLDWRDYRPRELGDPQVQKELIQFCRNISNALRKTWGSPEERQQRQEAEALTIAAEEERRRKTQIEAAARAAEEESKKLTEPQAQTVRQSEDERQRRAAEASRAEQKQRGKVVEAPIFAAASVSNQNTNQEPSLSAGGNVMSEISRTSWWQTLPGVLIAVVALLASITGLILALNLIGIFNSSPNANHPAPQVADHGSPQAPAPQVADHGSPQAPAPQVADHGSPQTPAPQVVPVQGPSFDCKTNRRPVEQAICGDAELSSKDRVLQDLYSQVLGGLSGQARTDLIQAENLWVTQRNQCHDPGMAACIAQTYDARIRELKAAAH
jgi:hypothetical protein